MAPAESKPITAEPTPENRGNLLPVNESGAADVLDRGGSPSPQTGQPAAARLMSTLNSDDTAVSEPQTFAATTFQEPAINGAAAVMSAPDTVTQPAPPATITNVATRLVASLLAPFVAPPSPLAPAEPPLLWAVLGWVRREVQRTFVNRGPDAVNDAFTTSEDITATGNVLTNDTDGDGDAVTATLVSGPQHGAVTLGSDGSFSYTPTADYTGTDTFSYKVGDKGFHLHGLLGFLRPDSGHTDTATVTITVSPVNDAPAARNDVYSIAEDSQLVVGGPGVLGGDKDADNAGLTVTGSTAPAHGGVTMGADGSFTYSPDVNFHGTDTFDYTVSDGTLTDTGTVTITVTSVPDAPLPASDTTTTNEDTPVAIDVLANDTDGDNDPLTVTGYTQPDNGSVVDNNGTLTYSPDADFHGTDTFSYAITDGNTTASATVTVTVTVTAVDPPPGDATFTVNGRNTNTGVVTGLVDVPNGDGLTYALGAPLDPAIGAVAVNPTTGAWAFAPTPEARFDAWNTPGQDTVQFTINAVDGDTTRTVEVAAPIEPAADFRLDVIEPRDQELSAQGLAVDPDGQIYLTQYLANDTTGRVIVVNPGGSVAAVVNIGPAVSYAIATANDIAVGPDGRIYVSSELANSWDDFEESYVEAARGAVIVIDPADDYSAELFAELAEPAAGLAVDSEGRVFVSSAITDTVTVLAPDGSLDTTLSGGDTSMALGPDGLYVAKTNGVSIVAADGSVVDTYDLVGDPSAVAVGPNGVIYVTNFNTGAVTVLNADGSTAHTFDLGRDSFPSDIAIGGDGRIYVPFDGTGDEFIGKIGVFTPIPVQNTAPFDVVTVDSDTGAVTGRVNVLDPGGNTNSYTLAAPIDSEIGTVTVDPENGQFTFTPTSDARFGAWKTPGADTVDFTVSAFDGRATTPVAVHVTLDPAAGFTITAFENAGDAAAAVAVTADGRVFVTNFGAGAVTALTPDGAVDHIIDLGGQPYGVVIGRDGWVYVADYEGGTISGIDPADYSVAMFADVPSPARLAVASDGRLWVTTAQNGAVTVLNVDGSVAETYDIGGIPVGIAVAADGTFYVTDFEDGTVKVFDSAGTQIGTIQVAADSVAIGPDGVLYVTDFSGNAVRPINADGSLDGPIFAGNNPAGIAIDGDGHIYVSNYVGGTVTMLTPTPVEEPVVVTPIGNPIPGNPGSYDGAVLTGPVVAADGTVYQTATNRDADGTDTVVVAVISPTGDTTFTNPVAGEPVGTVAIGGDGRAYQTVSYYDEATGTAASGVVVIEPTGDSSFTGYQEGQPAGPIVVGTDGTAYQALYHLEDDGTSSTTVLVITDSGATPFTLDGLPGSTAIGEVSGPVVAPDGTVYQTAGDWVVDPDTFEQSDYTTTVAILSPTGATAYSIEGVSGGHVVIGSNGAAYQPIVEILTNSDTGAVTATTRVAVLADDGLVRLANGVSGLPIANAIVGSDGTLYQTIVNPDAVNGEHTTTVATISSLGVTQIGEGIPGLPLTADGSLTPVVVGPDSTAYQLAYLLDPNTATYRTTLAVISPAGDTAITEIEGDVVGTVVTGPSDTAFVTTHDSGTTWVTVISSTQTNTYAVDGFPNGSIVLGTDGTAYQTVGQVDPHTNELTTTVAVIAPTGVTYFSAEGLPGGPVVIGPDGVVYQSIGHQDSGGGASTTTVAVISPAGLTPITEPVDGVPGGGLVRGADGGLYQTVVNANTDADTFTTLVYRIPPAAATGTLAVGTITFATGRQAVSAPVATIASLGFAPGGGDDVPDANAQLRSAAATAADSTLAATAMNSQTWSITIDATVLRPFLDADPTAKFYYTRYLVEHKGDTITAPYFADDAEYQQYLAFVGAYVGHANFSRNSQGRLVYTNRYSQDVMVLYAERLDTPIPQGVHVVRPGQSVTLPAAPLGNFAVAVPQSYGIDGFGSSSLSVAYLNARLSPGGMPGAFPSNIRPVSTGPQISYAKKTSQSVLRITVKPYTGKKAPEGAGKLYDETRKDGLDGLRIDSVRGTGNQVRLIVYMGGTNQAPRLPALRNLNLIAGYQDPYIASRIAGAAAHVKRQYGYSPEIMLVGFSQGGMDAQNLARLDSQEFNIAAVVTFGSPLTQKDSSDYETVHIRATTDPVPELNGWVPFARAAFGRPGITSNSVYWSFSGVPKPNISLPPPQAWMLSLVSPFITAPFITASVYNGIVNAASTPAHDKVYPWVGDDFAKDTNPHYHEIRVAMNRFQGDLLGTYSFDEPRIEFA